MNYYLLSPLYQGDISIESIFENGKVTKLVYELDEIWDGSRLICGTDEFICEKSLADELLNNNITGFSVSDMTVIYEGDKETPVLKRMSVNGNITVKKDTYSNASADICTTKNVGELAVSERAFKLIGMQAEKKLKPHVKKDSYSFYLKTPLSYELLTEELPDGITVVREGDIYKISGGSENKVLLFLSCIDSSDAYIGKSANKLMEYEQFFMQ